MNILALDLGLKTGWALLENGRVESGVESFAVRRDESPGMKYVRFNRWLEEIVSTGLQSVHNSSRVLQQHFPQPHVHLVAYEMPHHRGGAATETAAGFATRVQELCARLRVEHTSVHSATLKKFATGKGNAKKPAMIEAAREKLRRPVSDENEADALWVLEYVKESGSASPARGSTGDTGDHPRPDLGQSARAGDARRAASKILRRRRCGK